MTQQKQNGNLVAIITMFFIFAMISFVTNLAAPFGTIWRNEYAGSNTLGMMGNMMNFLAYLFMGIPAGNMLVKIGYKKTALIAMAVGFLGLFTQYLSSLFGANAEVFAFGEYAIKLNFVIYLLGAFICGFCVCMLNTVVNPMLNLLGGGGNKGNQLIQTGGALNSLSGTLTPLFVGALSVDSMCIQAIACCKIDVVLVCIEVVSRREGAVRHDIPVPPCERGPARLNP